MPVLTLCLSSFLYSDLLSGIKKEAEAGRLPANVASGMEELYWNYKNAVNESFYHSLVCTICAMLWNLLGLKNISPLNFTLSFIWIGAMFF